MSNIPPGQPDLAEKLRFAEHYISVGWSVFVVRATKSTFPNCDSCSEATFEHNAATCGHLFCHGHYAASRDISRVRAALLTYPGGLLAVATGQTSGIVVLDFDTAVDEKFNPDKLSGLDVHDRWASFTNGIELPVTLTAQTSSGGRHLIYRTDDRLTSRNRILPGVDVKANGGYVVVPPGQGRAWIHKGMPTALPDDLCDWLRQRRGGSANRRRVRSSGVAGRIRGETSGIDLQEIMVEGCPAGCRDDFFNSLIFQLRKIGIEYDQVQAIASEQWTLAEKPEGDNMSWRSIEYKIDRIFRLVEPDPNVRAGVAWARSATARQQRREQREQLERGEVVQTSRRGKVRHPGSGR